jgi:hypothetical protein
VYDSSIFAKPAYGLIFTPGIVGISNGCAAFCPSASAMRNRRAIASDSAVYGDKFTVAIIF